MKVKNRKEIFENAQKDFSTCTTKLSNDDLEELFFLPAKVFDVNEYLKTKPNWFNKITDWDLFSELLEKYYIIYKDYYSVWRDETPNMHCDYIKEIYTMYYLRARWIFLGLAEWDDSLHHYKINDLAVQLYTNIQSVEEFKDLMKKYGWSVDKHIQVKHFAMLTELEHLINYQLIHDNTESN